MARKKKRDLEAKGCLGRVGFIEVVLAAGVCSMRAIYDTICSIG